ncbi:response regulator transcription factor [Agrococcus jejuensis]|uniref:DNA-binding response regulator, NarL/FixJ family, contains REC and HTH domains n=1 Tax=Agrococcus jejuensis TaxID=399736 RepID=A0A1G8C6F9_9MICO|nr:response regulator transcription factor [Agrococcus jejuensis]SDH41101.1 DNA-binding response regulator, NarL/FixJ family, contains REC and HTH domains [Agrococcus jejuensis]
MPPVRIAIVEDDAFVAGMLRQLIEASEGYDVVGDAADAAGIAPLVAAHFPDVLLVDVRLGEASGIVAIDALRRSGAARPRVVFMTAQLDDRVVRDALEVGLDGFLHKSDVAGSWRAAVDAAVRGEVVLSPIVGSFIARQAADADRLAERRRVEAAVASLTDADRAVLRVLPEGLPVPELARAVHVGATSVKQSLARIQQALGVDNRTQATVLVVRHGILDER